MPMKGRKCLTIILIIGGVVMFLWTSFLLTSFSYYHYYHQSSSPSPRRSFSALINTDLIHIDYPSGFKSDISSKSIDKDDKIFFLVNTSTKDPSLSQTSLILSSHEYSGPIFVDWIRPSYHFNNINYKSMESLLITYPHSNIQMTVIGPQSANYYKLGDLMSKHTFEKYKKRGYKVTTDIVSDFSRVSDLIGRSYWDLQEKLYCKMNGAISFGMKDPPPYHVFFFVRLQKLYRQDNGGIFSDLSWIHLRPFSAHIQTGYHQSTVCSVDQSDIDFVFDPLLSLTEPDFSPFTNKPLNTCYTSSIMIFRSGSHLKSDSPSNNSRRVLECALQKYSEIDGPLRTCLDLEPPITGGAMCVQRALLDCFISLDIPNQLQPSDLEFFENNPQASLDFLYSPPQSASLLTSLSNYHSCFMHYLDKKISVDGVVKLLSCWKDLPVSAIWLGTHLGVGQRIENGLQDWIFPHEETVLYSLFEWIQSQLTLKLRIEDILPKKFLKQNNTQYPSKHCHKYSEDEDLQVPHPFSKPQIGRASVSCSMSFVIPGFMKSATSFLFESLVRHPQILHALRGVRFKAMIEAGCYLADRANIEPAVHPKSRLGCYPFLEEHESVYIYGDATVGYSILKGLPEKLKRDNPNIKAIFVIRDPVDRFISHYKFTVDQCKQYGLGNVPEAVEYLFRNGNNSLIYQFKKAADQALSISSLSSQEDFLEKAPMELLHLIDLFYQGFGAKNKTDNLAMTLLHQSLYFPVIYHWVRVLGVENVLVLQTELLHLSDQNLYGGDGKEKTRQVVREQLSHVHRFLGIVPFDGVLFQELHDTAELIQKSFPSLAKKKFQSNDPSLIQLQVYFRPFNELLTKFLRTTKISPVDIDYS